MNQQFRGFTIVELLIVIVVIAILAAISMVMYGNISNRANDAVVQSDIRNFAMQIREQQVYQGTYPLPTNASGVPSNGQAPNGVEGIKFAEGSYDMSVANIYYCVGNIDGSQHFGIAATSKSGRRWMQHSLHGAKEYTGTTWGSAVQICNNGMGFGQGGESRMYTNAINAPVGGGSSGTWKVWANK